MCTARISTRRCLYCAARRARGLRLAQLARGLSKGVRLTVERLTRGGQRRGGRSFGPWGAVDGESLLDRYERTLKSTALAGLSLLGLVKRVEGRLRRSHVYKR